MGGRFRVPAVVGSALALAWVAGAAPAAAQDVPPAVTAWFAQDAPTVAADVLVGGAVDITSAAPRASVFTVGEPVALHRWSEEFVEGAPVEPLAFAGEWVAPLSRDGVVVGTIAAVESDGAVTFSYVDDDSSAGSALTDEPAGDVVQDPQLGGLIDVDETGEVEALSGAAVAPVAGVDSVTELQAVVEDAHDADAQTLAADGAGFGADAGPDLRTVAGVALLGAGALLLLRRRSPARSL